MCCERCHRLRLLRRLSSRVHASSKVDERFRRCANETLKTPQNYQRYLKDSFKGRRKTAQCREGLNDRRKSVGSLLKSPRSRCFCAPQTQPSQSERRLKKASLAWYNGLDSPRRPADFDGRLGSFRCTLQNPVACPTFEIDRFPCVLMQ